MASFIKTNHNNSSSNDIMESTSSFISNNNNHSAKRLKLDSEALIKEALERLSNGSTPFERLTNSSSLLNSYHLLIKSREEHHEETKINLQSEINEIENAIRNVDLEIQRSEEKLIVAKEEYNDQLSKYKQTRLLEDLTKHEDEECLIDMLRKDMMVELEKKQTKLQGNLEKTRRLELCRMEKRIKEHMINAKASKQKVCLQCGTLGVKLSMCSRCECVYYCNEMCQREHWCVHQHFCNK